MTTIQQLIKELEDIKLTKCQHLHEIVFFDGVLAIIESKFLGVEKEELIQSFLAGKQMADGESFLPESSQILAEMWFKNKYTNESDK